MASRMVLWMYKNGEVQDKYLRSVPANVSINTIPASAMLAAMELDLPELPKRDVVQLQEMVREQFESNVSLCDASLPWDVYVSRNKEQWLQIHGNLYPRCKSLFEDWIIKPRPLPYSLFNELIKVVSDELADRDARRILS